MDWKHADGSESLLCHYAFFEGCWCGGVGGLGREFPTRRTARAALVVIKAVEVSVPGNMPRTTPGDRTVHGAVGLLLVSLCNQSHIWKPICQHHHVNPCVGKRAGTLEVMSNYVYDRGPIYCLEKPESRLRCGFTCPFLRLPCSRAMPSIGRRSSANVMTLIA